VHVDTLVLADATGARIAGFMRVPESGAARAHLRADSLPLADFGTLAQLPAALAGRASFDLDVTGTRLAPVMAMTAGANGLTYGTYTAEAIKLRGAYDRARAELQGQLLRGGRSAFDANVEYPIALTLFSASSTGDSVRGRLHADSVDLALIQAIAPSVRNAAGRMAVDLAISGKPDHPHVGGAITLHDGALEVPDAGLRIASIEGRVSVDAARDSLSIDQLRWTTPVNGGSGSLRGSVVFRDIANPRLDLRLDGHALRAVDRRNIARLDVSTGQAGLTLAGTLASARMTGALKVDRGTIYIPELIGKQLEDLSESDFASLFDTTDVRYRSLMPRAPSKLVAHLRLDGVSVNIGDDVWLRSKEANIKLGGSLSVTRAKDERESGRSVLARDDQADTERYVLALSGSLSADRGTYALMLGPALQRQFQVQSGRITFFGTPDFNPEIDVTALYNVKQTNRADIGVQARIFGNFYPAPALSLTSSDASIASSDLVSYLVMGRPSAELNNSNDPTLRRAADLLLPSLGAFGSQQLGAQFGSFLDMFQIQSGTLGDQTDTQGGVGNVLRTTRLGAEKQISDRLFLSLSTGLCALNFSQSASGSPDPNAGLKGFTDALEGKLEYRLPVAAPDRFALRIGREPAARDLRCGATSNVRGFVPTPQQLGISLFRSWSF
jgi:translocation and assembly module TamB